MKPELVETKTEFAKRVALSKSYISELVKKGLPCNAAGLVRVEAALRWIRENVNGSPGRPAGSAEGGEADDLTAAKTRLVLAQAARAEHDLLVRHAEYIPKDEARRALRAVTRTTRDMFLNFSARHGAEMAGELGVDPGTFIGMLEAHIRKALNEAADQPMPTFGSDGDE
jgi:hypothetical protein